MEICGAREARQVFRSRHQGELEISLKEMAPVGGDEGRAHKAGIPQTGAGGEEGTLLAVERAPGDHHDLPRRQGAGPGETIHFPAEALDTPLQGSNGFLVLHDFIREKLQQEAPMGRIVKFCQSGAGELQIS